MSATVEASASAMESAATVEAPSASTMEAISAAESASAVERVPSMYTAGVAASITVGIHATSVAEARTPIKAAAIISAIPELGRMTPVIPRTRPDKESIHEPVWPVVAIRGTGIGIIVVIAVFTDRRPGNITRPDANSY